MGGNSTNLTCILNYNFSYIIKNDQKTSESTKFRQNKKQLVLFTIKYYILTVYKATCTIEFRVFKNQNNKNFERQGNDSDF